MAGNQEDFLSDRDLEPLAKQWLDLVKSAISEHLRGGGKAYEPPTYPQYSPEPAPSEEIVQTGMPVDPGALGSLLRLLFAPKKGRYSYGLEESRRFMGGQPAPLNPYFQMHADARRRHIKTRFRDDDPPSQYVIDSTKRVDDIGQHKLGHFPELARRRIFEGKVEPGYDQSRIGGFYGPQPGVLAKESWKEIRALEAKRQQLNIELAAKVKQLQSQQK